MSHKADEPKKLTREEYLEAMSKFPCPACSVAGHMAPYAMTVTAEYKAKTIHVEGEGAKCGSCGHAVMSQAMVESFANQVARIENGMKGMHYEASRESGALVAHTLQ